MLSITFSKLIPNAQDHFIYQKTDIYSNQSLVAEDMGFTPDIRTTPVKEYAAITSPLPVAHSVCPLNIMGYIPVVSTFSGIYRTLVGLAYLIKCVAYTIFGQKKGAQYQEGVKIARANICRGLFEIIPIVGNIIVGTYDFGRRCGRLRTIDSREDYGWSLRFW